MYVNQAMKIKVKRHIYIQIKIKLLSTNIGRLKKYGISHTYSGYMGIKR